MSERSNFHIEVPDSIPGVLTSIVQVPVRIRQLSPGAGPVSVLIRAVGNLIGLEPAIVVDLPDGAAYDVTLPVQLPPGMPPGRHRILIQVLDRAVGDVEVSFETSIVVERSVAIVMGVSPVALNAHRAGKFRVNIRNNDDVDHVVKLRCETDQPGMKLSLRDPEVHLRPGDYIRVKGRYAVTPFAAGPLREQWFTVIGEMSGAAVYARAAVRHRPVINRGIMRIVGLIAVVALWLAGTYAVVRTIDRVSSESAATAAGGTDSGTGTGTGTGGETSVGEVTPPIAVSGTVTAVPDGSGVTVEWRSVTLADTTESTGKSAPVPPPADVRSENTVTDAKGAFEVAGLAPDLLYEFRFSKPGHATQTVLVRPAGKPAVVEIALVPGKGTISGSVIGGGIALGGATVTLTDGSVTYTLSTPTDGPGRGGFSFNYLSTPGTYVLQATAPGWGVASATIELSAGSSNGAATLAVSRTESELLGTVSSLGYDAAGGAALSGATVTATDGTITRTTSTLSQPGLEGYFSLSSLPLGRQYTLTFAADGYSPQTQLFDLNLDGPKVVPPVSLARSTGAVRGQITTPVIDPSTSLTPDLVAIRLVGKNRTYQSTVPIPDAVAASAGAGGRVGVNGGPTSVGSTLSFGIENVDPGDYTLVLQAAGLVDHVESVSVVPGVTNNRPLVPLVATSADRGGSVTVVVTDKEGKPLDDSTGAPVQATVRMLYRQSDCGVVAGSVPSCSWSNPANAVTIGSLAPGSYVFKVSAVGFGPQTAVATVPPSAPGAGPIEVPVALFNLGTLQGIVTDEGGAPVQGVQVTLTDSIGTAQAAPTTTSANGLFSFPGQLETKNYLVDFSLSGYDIDQRAVVGSEDSTLYLAVVARRQATLTGEVKALNSLSAQYDSVPANLFELSVKRCTPTTTPAPAGFCDLNSGNWDTTWTNVTAQGLVRQLGNYRLALAKDSTYQVCVSFLDPLISTATPDCDDPLSAVAFVPAGSLVSFTDTDTTAFRSFFYSAAKATVGGVVRLPGGAVVGDVDIIARRIDEKGLVLETAAVSSRGDGTYSFTNLTPTRASSGGPTPCSIPSSDASCWRITASSDQGVADSLQFALSPGQVLPLDLTLSKLGNLVAEVRSSAGLLAGAVVTVTSVGGAGSPQSSCTTTLPSGQCRFASLITGEYTVTVAKTGYVSSSVVASVNAGQAAALSFNLDPAASTVTVTVVSASGAPLADASVAVDGAGVSCTTSAGGVCSIGGLNAITAYTLRISKAGYTTVDQAVVAGQTTASVTLTAVTSSVQVDVQDGSTNLALTGVVVSATVGSTTVACSATYLCSGLPLGVAVVTATLSGYVTSSSTVTVVAGSTASLTMTLDPVPPATVTLAVTVQSAPGSPLVDATVLIVGAGTSCVTNSSGVCSFNGLAAANPHVLRVSKAGFVTGDQLVSAGATTQTVTLTAATSSVLVDVRDGVTGATIAGASVTMTGGTPNPCSTNTADPTVYRACTISGLALGVSTVTASKTGYADSSATVTVVAGSTSTVTVTLKPLTLTLTVTVQSVSGVPLADATVLIVGAGTSCVTNSSGQCPLTGIGAADPQTLRVSKAGYVTDDQSVAAGVTAQTVTLTAVTSSVVVDVRDGVTGATIVGASVVMAGGTPNPCTTADTPPTVYRACTISGLTLGVTTVIATKTGYVDGSATATVVAGSTSPVTVTLQPSTSALTVTVLSAAAAPIADATVVVVGAGLVCVTNSAGSCSINGLSETSAYTVRVSKAGFVTTDQPIAPGTTAQSVTLAAAASEVLVDVRDASTGATLAGATVTIIGGTGSPCSTGTSAYQSCTITGLAAGVASVSVTKTGYVSGSATVTVLAGVASAVTVSLMPNGVAVSISGTVTSSGSGVLGAIVTAVLQGSGRVAVTTSGTNGAYTLAGLTAGTWDVTVSAPGYTTTTPVSGTTSVTVAAGTPVTASFTLTPDPSTLAVTVSTAFSSPITGATVRVGTITGGVFSQVGSSIANPGSATTGVDGLASLTVTQPGVYTVSVTDSITPARFQSQTFAIELQRGVTTRVPVHMAGVLAHVEATVVASAAAHLVGSPLSGLVVGLVPSTGSTIKATSAVVGTTAAVSFDNVTDGKWDVRLFASTGSATPLAVGSTVLIGSTTYEVPSLGSVTISNGLDANLPEIRVVVATVPLTVTVSDSVAAAGIANATVVLSGGNVPNPLSGSTVAAGTFTFGAVPPGTYSLAVHAAGFVDQQNISVVVSDKSAAASASASASMVVAPGSVQVDVRDGSTGLVVSGATVTAVVGVTSGSCSVGYLCSGLPLGVASVSVSKTGYVAGSATVTVVAGSTASVTVTLQPTAAATLTLAVTVRSGSGVGPVVAGASVVVVGEGLVCLTDASGVCSVPGLLASAAHTVRVARTGFATVDQVVAIGVASATVVLTAATGSVQVDVRDGLTGDALSGAVVTAVVGATSGTCSEGDLCSGLPLGIATVTVSMTGYSTATASVTVVDGSTASLTVNLQPNVGSVKVTYKEGASGTEVVTGSRAFSLTASGFSTQSCTTSSVAGASKGTCTISSVPPGTYTLTDSTSSQSTTITVQAGRSTTLLLTNTTPANTYVWSAA